MNSSFTFAGHSIDVEKGSATFSYKFQTFEKTYNFIETIHFPTKNISQSIPPELLKTILDNLLLILGISYWKAFCPNTIQTLTIQLTKAQAQFWNTVYTMGLGEFFYKNNIDYHELIQFPFDQNAKKKTISFKRQQRSLVLFGGGKDSIVSAEMLKENNKPFSLFLVNESIIQKETAALVGKEKIIFTRILDPQLLDLNKQIRTYNGHVPVTAIWSFLGLFAAIVYDYHYVIGSNEHSANYGNVMYLGKEINHQWSKSLAFENLFHEYTKKYITPDITYFSLLRGLHEIKITQLFSKYTDYFPYFSSCNRNFTMTHKLSGKRWCGECPKCLFVFILLAAFLSKKDILGIFGKNLFDQEPLVPLLKGLLGQQATKPFECVGTPEEVTYALFLIHQKGEFENTPLMKFFEKDVLPTVKDIQELEKRLLSVNTAQNIPEEFATLI